MRKTTANFRHKILFDQRNNVVGNGNKKAKRHSSRAIHKLQGPMLFLKQQINKSITMLQGRMQQTSRKHVNTLK